MATSSATNLGPNGTVPGSSSALKLFNYSREAEFVSGSSPAASQVFRNLDLSIAIVENLSPENNPKPEDTGPYVAVSTFGRICTATYPGAMAVLYRSVSHVPLLWSILVDRRDMLEYGHVSNFTEDPVMFSYLLKLVYDKFTRDLDGEDIESYKLRRFFYSCAQVQTLWANSEVLTPALCDFLSSHLPFHREYLFPALKNIYWIEKDRKQPKISLRPSPISIPAFQAFRPSGLRFIEFEIHDLSAPLCSVLRDEKAIGRIEELFALLKRTFLSAYMLNICVCRPDYHTNPFTRTVIDRINSAVLKTDAIVNTQDIPMSFFSSSGHWATYGVKENLNIDVVTAKGRTSFIDPTAPYYLYPAEDNHIFSTITMTSPISFSLSYHTNMTLAIVSDVTILVEIMRPYLEVPNLQHLTLHLQSVAMPLFPHQLMQICKHWPQLRYLDLRFRVVRERIENMPTIGTVRTLMFSCPLLEHIYLPELNVQGFRDTAPGLQNYSLRTLTSAVLFSCDEEATRIALALLLAFPNVTNVMIDGVSAGGWESISKAINNQLYNYVEDITAMLAGGMAAPFIDNINHPGAQTYLV